MFESIDLYFRIGIRIFCINLPYDHYTTPSINPLLSFPSHCAKMANMKDREKTLPLIVRFFRHLSTVNHHRYAVMKNCFACGLYYQGLTHDLSKYAPSEFLVSVKYFQGYRSPYMKEKELKGYSLGWLHHKGRNRHHWEYWYDTINGVFGPQRMPYKYLVESVCDRVAACMTYEKDKYTKESALRYFNTRPDKRYMHPDTAMEMEKMLKLIADVGEKEAFKIFRKELKTGRKY